MSHYAIQDVESYLKNGGVVSPAHTGGGHLIKDNNCSETGLWVVTITNKINSDQQAYLTMSKNGPTVTNVSVNQQVNDRIIMHCGGGSHFMANTIQTNSSSELDNYHHQPLGSSTT